VRPHLFTYFPLGRHCLDTSSPQKPVLQFLRNPYIPILRFLYSPASYSSFIHMPRHTSKHDSAASQIYSTQYNSVQYLSDSSQSAGHSPQSPTAPSSISHQSSQSSGTANGKKKHVCSTCDRGFTTSGHLARHLRVHTGERNHKCPFPGCETRCSRQDNLQQQ